MNLISLFYFLLFFELSCTLYLYKQFYKHLCIYKYSWARFSCSDKSFWVTHSPFLANLYWWYKLAFDYQLFIIYCSFNVPHFKIVIKLLYFYLKDKICETTNSCEQVNNRISCFYKAKINRKKKEKENCWNI